MKRSVTVGATRGTSPWLCATVLVVASACGGGDTRSSAGSEGQIIDELPAEGVPECLGQIDFTSGGLTVVARLQDSMACEGGDLDLEATWTDGRTQRIEIGAFGYPTDIWPIDLNEDGTLEVVVGHQDLSGNPPRIRVYRDEAGGLREVPVPELTRDLLEGYEGGGNFHSRGGALFFNWIDDYDGTARVVRLDPDDRRWGEVDPSTFETDRPRRPGAGGAR